MNETVSSEDSKKVSEVSGTKKSTLKTILFVGSLLMLVSYNAYTIFLSGLGFEYTFQGTFSDIEGLKEIYETAAENSALLNPIEIIIWVGVPGVLITYWLSAKSIVKTIATGSIILIILFGIVWVSNQLNLNKRTNSYISGNYKVAELFFNEIKYHDVNRYEFEDDSTFTQKGQSMVFKTGDSIDNVKTRYLARGFEEKEKNRLRKNLGDFGGSERSISVSLNEEKSKTRVNIYTSY